MCQMIQKMNIKSLILVLHFFLTVFLFSFSTLSASSLMLEEEAAKAFNTSLSCLSKHLYSDPKEAWEAWETLKKAVKKNTFNFKTSILINENCRKISDSTSKIIVKYDDIVNFINNDLNFTHFTEDTMPLHIQNVIAPFFSEGSSFYTRNDDFGFSGLFKESIQNKKPDSDDSDEILPSDLLEDHIENIKVGRYEKLPKIFESKKGPDFLLEKILDEIKFDLESSNDINGNLIEGVGKIVKHDKFLDCDTIHKKISYMNVPKSDNGKNLIKKLFVNLFNSGKIDINKNRGIYGSLLVASAANADVGIVELLIDFGANVNQASTHGETAAFAALKNEDECIPILKLLLRNKYNLSALGPDGLPLATKAFFLKYGLFRKKLLQFLLDETHYNFNIKDSNMETLFHHTLNQNSFFQESNFELAYYLYKEKDADCTLENNKGISPLMMIVDLKKKGCTISFRSDREEKMFKKLHQLAIEKGHLTKE